MLPFQLSETEIIVFGLVLLRVTAYFMTWPVFSQFTVPSPVKVLLSVAVTFVIFAVIPRGQLQQSTYETGLIWLATKEVFVGIAMGFVSRLTFYTVEVAGNIASTSMGLSSATVFNPSSGTSTTVLEKFHLVLLTLLFLGLNAHHTFISAMVESFTAVPLSPSGIDLAAFGINKGGGEMLQRVTIAGFKMAAPVMVVIFFLNVAMGIIGRAVPQINVLVTSLPVNILAGLLVTVVTLPALIFELDRDLAEFTDLLFRFMRSL